MSKCFFHIMENGETISTGTVRFEESRVSGGGSEYPRIEIPGEINVPKSSKILTIMRIFGQAEVRGKRNFIIGDFSEELMHRVESHPLERTFKLTIPIDFWRLENIEKHRKKDLILNLCFRLEYMIWDNNSKETKIGAIRKIDCGLVIPQSTWVDALINIGFNRIKILEINFPEKIIGKEKYNVMIDHFQQANNFYLEGDYESAVEECRLAIEPIPQLLPIKKIVRKDGKEPTFDDKLKQFCKEHLQTMIGKEKTKLLTKLIWNFSSMFHHPDSTKQTKKVFINRFDAELVIHITSGILAYLGKILMTKN